MNISSHSLKNNKALVEIRRPALSENLAKFKKNAPFGGLAKTEFFGAPLATQDKGLHTKPVNYLLFNNLAVFKREFCTQSHI